MRILFLGDTHAAWHRLDGIIKICTRDFGVSVAIQVGDFGFFKQYAPNPLGNAGLFRSTIPLHVIDGNHEDHKWIKGQSENGSAKVWSSDQNIIFQPRGSVLDLSGIKIGLCGGALHADRRQSGSIDKKTTNWVTNQEAEMSAEKFTTAKVDIIVSHSCPAGIGVGMSGNPYLAESVDRYISQKGFDAGPISDCGEPGLRHLWHLLRHKPKEWVYGHFHVHRTALVQGVRFRCIGALDGSDHQIDPMCYIFDTSTQSWSKITCNLEANTSSVAASP